MFSQKQRISIGQIVYYKDIKCQIQSKQQPLGTFFTYNLQDITHNSSTCTSRSTIFRNIKIHEMDQEIDSYTHDTPTVSTDHNDLATDRPNHNAIEPYVCVVNTVGEEPADQHSISTTRPTDHTVVIENIQEPDHAVEQTSLSKKLKLPTFQLTENIDDFIKQQQNQATLRKTEGHVKTFRNFLKTSHLGPDISENFETFQKDILDEAFAKFIISVRKHDGSNYEPEYLRSIFNSINRHLRANNNANNLSDHTNFPKTTISMKSKMTQLKKIGKGNRPKKSDALSDDDVNYLYDKGQLGVKTPQSIINSLWLNNTVHFGMRAVKEHYTLMWGDVKQKYDDQEQLEYLVYDTERQTKTRTGTDPRNIRLTKPRIYTEGVRCPVQLYKAYKDHRPADMCEDSSPFYLNKMPNPSSSQTVWFKKMRMGENTIGTIMKNMIKNSGLETDRHLTNTSGRKHLVQKLKESNVGETEIIQITGHKDTRSLKAYHDMSAKQSRLVSSILHDTKSQSLVPMTQSTQCEI